MSAKPASQRLRELLLHVLPTDADLMAFVMDHHRAMAQRFTDGQDRVQRTNLLLWHVAGQTVLTQLKAAWPVQVAAFESAHGPVVAADFVERLRFAHPGQWLRTQAVTFLLGAGVVAGLWLVLHAARPLPITPAVSPDLSPPPKLAASAADLAQAQQPLSGNVRDCHGRPARDVRIVILGKQAQTRSDSDGQFTLTVPGGVDEAVKLRIQTSPTESHDHWVNLGHQDLTLLTQPCDP